MTTSIISAAHRATGTDTAARPLPVWTVPAIAASLILAIVLAYQGIELNGFHFDDSPNILDRPAITISQLSLAALANAAHNAFLPLRPLPSITFALDWWRGGGAPAPFLVTNLALHILSACGVLALLLRILNIANPGKSPAPAVIAATAAALWWALQPIHVQAVSYVVQRMTILAALFSLLSVLAYIQGRSADRHRAIWLVASLASFALGSMSKENTWITPLLLLSAEFLIVRHGKSPVRSSLDRMLIALPILAGLAVLADLMASGPLGRWALAGYETRSFTLAERLLTQPKVVLFHVSQILWPLPQRFSLEHDVEIIRSAASIQFWLPALVITAWCATALLLTTRPRHRITAFWMLWIPVTLAIESSFVPLELVFEHRMYLPSVGFAGLIAQGLSGLPSKIGVSTATGWAILSVAILLSLWSTHERIPQWRTETSLYQQAVKVAPNSARAWNHLGVSLLNQRRSEPLSSERYARALAAFGESIRLDPNYAAPWTNRGVTRWIHNEPDAAQHDLETAIALSPKEAAAFHYLFEIYQAAGREIDARAARHRACFLGVRGDCYR